jgi:SAM-dependent methyltransferase
MDWIVQQVLKNLLMHVEPIVYLRKRLFSRENDPLSSIGEYFDFQWQTYRDAIAGAKLSFGSTNILEVGPGPILANGVRSIAEGATSYTALDRFDLLRRDIAVRRAYKELIDRLPDEQRQRCLGLITEGSEARMFDDRIQSIVGKIEDSTEKLANGKWDFVVSFDVLEHVDDLTATLRSIRRLLKPGGVMVHRVDVTIHNATPDTHRLAHLGLSDQLWRMISSRRAVCNRFRPSEFLLAANNLGFETLCYQPTTMLTQEEIARIRPKLWKKYASCSFEDLAVLDFVWIARAPA